MKRFCLILIPLLVFLSALRLSLDPLAKSIAAGMVRKALPGSAASISGCRFDPFGKIILSGIRISKHPDFDLRIERIEVRYGFIGLVKNLRGNIASAVNYGEISFDTLEAGELKLTRGHLRAVRGSGEGSLGIGSVKWGKLSLRDIQGKVSLQGDILTFVPLSGMVLGGSFKGTGRIRLAAPLEYEASLELSGLDLARLVKDFELEEKAELSGTAGGSLKLRGSMPKVDILEGIFFAGKDGGLLTIKDTGFLRTMARNSGVAQELIVESFKNYRYNTGRSVVSLEGKDIVLQADMDGEAGKRGLNIRLHDFNPGRYL